MGKPEIVNPIIIIGGDHHNTLAVIRDLGRHKCNIFVLVHTNVTNRKNIGILYSKYVKNKVDIVGETPDSILQWLLERKYKNGMKAILFPCSDLAGYTIDKNYESLSSKYILPGFEGEPGKVAYLMDKYHQKEFADKYDIPMAETWKLEVSQGKFDVPKNVVYPCIVKPEISALGKKSDIRICEEQTQLMEALQGFSDNGAESAIIQHFLKKKYEVCSYGCMVRQLRENMGGGVILKLRTSLNGSTSYAMFIK